jgi:hypothetical protein
MLRRDNNVSTNNYFSCLYVIYKGQSKSSRNSLTSTVWYSMNYYRLNGVLLPISTNKFYKCCAMQLEESDATSIRDSGSSITVTHRATHRLLCSSPSPRRTFPSSPNHRTFPILIRVTFGCSLPWKWTSDGHVWKPWYQVECDGRTPEDSRRSHPSVLPTMARSMQQVCVCARDFNMIK